MLTRIAADAQKFRVDAAAALGSISAQANKAASLANSLMTASRTLSSQAAASRKADRERGIAALSLEQVTKRMDLAVRERAKTEAEAIKLRAKLRPQLNMELNGYREIGDALKQQKEELTRIIALGNTQDAKQRAAVVEERIAALTQLRAANNRAVGLTIAENQARQSVTEAQDLLLRAEDAAFGNATQQVTSLAGSVLRIGKSLVASAFDFNRLIKQSDTSLSSRAKLLDAAVTAGRATGQGIKESGAFLAELERFGRASTEYDALGKTLESGLKLNSALDVSYSASAQLAVTAESVGLSYSKAANSAAAIAERTSVAADEAARMVQDLSRLSYKFGGRTPSPEFGVQIAGLAEKLSVMQDTVNKQTPNARDLIRETLSSYTSYQDKGGRGVQFGTGGIDFMSREDAAAVAVSALKAEAAWLRMGDGNAAQFESMARSLGKSAEEAKAFIIAMESYDEGIDKYAKSVKSLDQIYAEQSRDTGEVFSQLFEQLKLLALQASAPILGAVRGVTWVLTKMNGAIAWLDAHTPSAIKWINGLQLGIGALALGASAAVIVIAATTIKAVVALDALALSIERLAVVSALSSTSIGGAAAAGGAGAGGSWMSKMVDVLKKAVGKGATAIGAGAAGTAVAGAGGTTAAAGTATGAATVGGAVVTTAIIAPIAAAAAVLAIGIGGTALILKFENEARRRRTLGNEMSEDEMARRRNETRESGRSITADTLIGDKDKARESTRTIITGMSKEIVEANARGDTQRAGFLATQATKIIEDSRAALQRRVMGERGVMNSNSYRYSQEERDRAFATQERQIRLMTEMLTTFRNSHAVLNDIARKAAVANQAAEDDKNARVMQTLANNAMPVAGF